MLALLSDGQRHHREQLMGVAMPLVPHARAVMVRNKSVERQRVRSKSATGAQGAQPTAIEDQARIGQRAIADSSLRGLVTKGRVKQDGDWFWLAGEDDR
jgi:hypothetical protein